MVLEVSTVETLEEVKIGRDCKGAFGVAGKFYFFNQCVDYVSRLVCSDSSSSCSYDLCTFLNVYTLQLKSQLKK